jgi:thymidylate synthase ThyX
MLKARLAYETTTATVVAKTKSPVSGAVITTMELFYPRFILAEVNTHGLFAKSTQSSRAVPLKTRILDLRENGVFVPDFHNVPAKNKPGMQAQEKLEKEAAHLAQMTWLSKAAVNAVESAEKLLELEVHKQHAARLLEPFMYCKTVVTATEWDNFFKLRMHPDAQPEFMDLATKMHTALHAAQADVSELHLPYVTDTTGYDPENSRDIEFLQHVSAARCARVSYFSFKTGRTPTVEDDVNTATKLIDSGHYSPFDHPATCSPEQQLTSRFKHWTAVRHQRGF